MRVDRLFTCLSCFFNQWIVSCKQWGHDKYEHVELL
jgi:hypothetical protein